MITGAATVLVWTYVPVLAGEDGLVPLGSVLYSIVPGFIFSFVAIIVFSLLSPRPKQSVEDMHDNVETEMNTPA